MLLLSTPTLARLCRNRRASADVATLAALLIGQSPITLILGARRSIVNLMKSADNSAAKVLSAILDALKQQVGEHRHELHRAILRAHLVPHLLDIVERSVGPCLYENLAAPALALMVVHDISQTDHLRIELGSEAAVRGEDE
nr:hypothetical protein HK105_003517 [Polyrhizophydium stewartii]